MYGFNNSPSVNWKSATISSQKIYYIDEKEIDLDDIIHATLPPIPLDVNFTGSLLRFILNNNL